MISHVVPSASARQSQHAAKLENISSSPEDPSRSGHIMTTICRLVKLSHGSGV
ncbi:hypothetical protein DOTSEDRAFT_44776 [Dothistroma septosporum NZE10]|uniref:Uncharacterized protein n=1 Tax=Dothistroma septosporum (strain NZE10 / CBS 128990) TaxID=675120 RepID=N1PNX2_DOTSN|nr:hypothetical protein DOTSEDRAFT_44776 [Dothistroma septosporum NZE10]